MSMYGTYRGLSFPLSTLAALVASRPSVWPLASITNHLRSISLPLGTNVDILFLPFEPAFRPIDARPVEINLSAQTALIARAISTRTCFPHCQTILFGVRIVPDDRNLPVSSGCGACPPRAPDSPEVVDTAQLQQKVACPGESPMGESTSGSGLHAQTPGATPHKVSRIRDSASRVNELAAQRTFSAARSHTVPSS